MDNSNYIVRDEFDRLAFEDSTKDLSLELKPSKHTDTSLSEDWVKNLGQEFYSLLYKSKPRVNGQFDGDPSIANLVEGFRLTDEVEELRSKSKFNQKTSAVAAWTLSSKIVDSLMRNSQRGMSYLSEMSQHGTDIDDVNSDSATELRLLINTATKDAQKYTDSLEIAAGLLAGSQASPLESPDVDEAELLTLSRMIRQNPEVMKMIKMTGQMETSARKAQDSKLTHGVDELYEVGTGRDIHRLLPSEFIKMKRNKRQFCMDFVEGKLMQYKLRGGTEPLEKGPVVVMIDVSFSMLADDKFTWSKAVLLTLHKLCKEQHRDLHAILFNAGVMFDRKLLESGKVVGKNIIDLLKFFPCGGTDFMYPLSRAASVVERSQDTSKKPDMLLVTDGFAPLTLDWKSKFLARKRKIGFSLHSFLISSEHEEGGLLQKFKDSVKDISDLCAVIPTVQKVSDEQYKNLFSI